MFQDREHAGQQLAPRLMHLAGDDVVVLGLPRGGMVVAAAVAETLRAPLDVLVVRKLGAPGRPELAIGAVTDGETPQVVLNDDVVRALSVDERYIDEERNRQLAEVTRRQALYRRGRAAARITDRTIIVVDDGIATGATVRAGLTALSRAPLRKLVLAVPVGPRESISALRAQVDELVCLASPAVFYAVGSFFADFRQTTDDEVIALLERHAAIERTRDGGDEDR